MTPSQRAKQLGCHSLAQVIKTSEIPERTLHDWFKNYPKRFDMACIYTVYITGLPDCNESNLATMKGYKG